MMMRISVMTVCLLAAAGSTQAEDFQVLGDVDGVAPQEMMATYLLTQAHTALDRRDERYEQLKTGERYQLLDDEGKPLVGGATAHSLVGVGCTLLGRNTATYRVWDGMRAIDYLQSREEIDPQRIGCTGNSGGGTLTSYLMALDQRVACAAPSCYLCGFRRICETIGPQDAEQNIHGQIAFGMDHADYILARAPKPTP